MTNTLTTFAHIFEANAIAAPDDPAFLAPGRLPLSNKAFYEQIVTAVETLNQMGIGRSTRIAVVAHGGAEVAVAFASLSCGTTCAVLNPSYRRDEFESMFTNMRIDALVYQQPADPALLEAARICNLLTIELRPLPDAECGRFTLHGDSRPRPSDDGFAQPDDICTLLPTSGTTGSSKIVPITHRMMIARVGPNLGKDVFPVGCLLHVMPMYHYSGQGYLVRTLIAGGSVICLPGFEIDSFFACLDEFKPIAFGGVATMLQSIVTHADAYRHIIQRHTLRYIRADGMALPIQLKNDLERLFGIPVMQLYASTEAGVMARYDLATLATANTKPGSVGKPFYLDIKIVDDDARSLPSGQTGEIIVRGDAVISAYDYTPEPTADVFRDGWYRTSDLGYFDADGDLFITGRVREVINRGGQKVSPAEVEQVLATHPEVKEAAVFGVPDSHLGEEIAAAIIVRSTIPPAADQLRQFAGRYLVEYKLPRHIFFVSDIPKTSIGKIERYKLTAQFRNQVSANNTSADYAAPQTSLEIALVAIWSAVLKKPRSSIGIHDEFQSLGGTSLSAARIVFKMREQFQLDIKLFDLFDAPTIQHQAAVITRLQSNHATLARTAITLVPIQPEGNLSPLYCLHALEGGIYLYRDLCAHLDPNQPVYGLQAVGLDDGNQPLDTIEAMSQHHLAQIEAVQSKGPYLLLGYSMGGRLALEIGRKLRDKGHTDVHVIMIDEHMQANQHVVTGSTPLRWGNIRPLNSLYNFLFAMLKLPARYRTAYLSERWRHLRQLLGHVPDRPTAPDKFDIALVPPTIQKVMQASDRAAKSYVLRPYNGDITYLRASGDIVNIPMFRALYYQATGLLTITDVPGTHYDVLREPNIQHVAAEVRKWLNSVSHQPK